MIHKPVYRGIASICGLIVVLGLGWGCDRLMQFMRYVNTQTFSLNITILWAFALVAVLLPAAWLLLAWFVLIRAPRNIWVSLIFLLCGSIIVASPVLYFTPGLGLWLSTILQVDPTTYLFSSGGFVAVLGVLGLILRRGRV